MVALGGESALAGIVNHCFGNAYCYFICTIGFVIIFFLTCNFFYFLIDNLGRFLNSLKLKVIHYLHKKCPRTQFQIEIGGVVQGVTKLFWTFSAFVT